ncbi:hypothetical protein QTN47_26825 [Danxiaibacter flavus]|uniref:Uncharacterized protein n=1 Tax=Danxiaibacter flavus TaxID=3049108 RepID=A0ABV3ZMP5_9BACT|nr:hypothetical protein QNM32_26825 [Chitinophagaceae bacterium DXS]
MSLYPTQRRCFIICLLVILSNFSFTKPAPDSTTMILSSLNTSQKTSLYQLAVLQQSGADAEAQRFWSQHQSSYPSMSNNLRDAILKEIFQHAKIIYVHSENAAVREWLQTQTLINWITYLAIMVAILAIIRLIYVYWNPIILFLIKQFRPLFRILFSTILLTYELLLAGITCVIAGTHIPDIAISTVIVHIGIFIAWGQLTALFTSEYLLADYFKVVRNIIRYNQKERIFTTLFFPVIITSALLLYVINKLPYNNWYYYELVMTTLLAIYSLPFVRWIEPRLSFVLLAFNRAVSENKRRIAHYTALLFFLWSIAMLFPDDYFPIYRTTISALLMLGLLITSLKEKNDSRPGCYIYLQVVTLTMLCCLLLASRHITSPNPLWLNLTGCTLFLVIKYWEIPTLFKHWQWNKNNAWWGLLGMAALLWLISKCIQYFICHY